MLDQFIYTFGLKNAQNLGTLLFIHDVITFVAGNVVDSLKSEISNVLPSTSLENRQVRCLVL